jgi:replication factor C subunit 2/4
MSIWIEKYRPPSLDDITGHTDIIQIFKNYIQSRKFPNIILYGGSGCGKTSSILAMAHDLYGKDFDSDVYELNASDERGIDVVRKKIHSLAKRKVSSSIGFKLIILDEADFLTKDAQAALRKIMEMYSDKTVFCLMCNYIYNIIPPIQSRCVSFYFKPLEPTDVSKKLTSIASNENLEIPEDTMDKILDLANGDLRKAIILLQQSILNKQEFTNTVHDDLVECIMTGTLDEINTLVENIYNDGYNIIYIVRKIFTSIIMDTAIKDVQKKEYIHHLMLCDKFLLLGCSEYLQLLKLATSMYYVRIGSSTL